MADDNSTVVEIPVGKRRTKMDAADVPLLYGRKVFLSPTGYAKVGNQLLHRLIMDAPKGLVVDHINGDPLDNRRANLRVCTQEQNLWNGKSHRDSTSAFRGVSFRPECCSWRAQISVGGQKSRFLGQFKNEIDAAMAYDRAALERYGEYARLNFPEFIHTPFPPKIEFA